MKKVILAVLMAASKEGISCDITISSKGGHMATSGSLKLDMPANGEQLTLTLWRSGEKSSLTLTPEESDLSVGTNDGKYEVGIGGVCITFQESFNQDPFTPNA